MVCCWIDVWSAAAAAAHNCCHCQRVLLFFAGALPAAEKQQQQQQQAGDNHSFVFDSATLQMTHLTGQCTRCRPSPAQLSPVLVRLGLPWSALGCLGSWLTIGPWTTIENVGDSLQLLLVLICIWSIWSWSCLVGQFNC